MEYNPEYKRMYNRYLSAFSTNINKAREQLNSISVPNDFSKKSDIDGIKRRLKEVDVIKVQREIDIICANIEKSERDAINAKFASMDINAPSMALNPLNRNTNGKNNELNPHSLNAIFNSQQGGLWENTKAFLANSMEISYEAQQLQTQANIEMAQKTGADIINTATALFWGIISGGEKIVDAFATFGTNFIIEQTQNELRDMEEDGHKDDKFREKTEKELETLRVNTMAYVAEEKTNNYFENEIYDSTFMQNVNETAHNPFKKEGVAFELTKGVGEAIPIITAGVVSGGKAWAIAATSAVIGFGNASQENLQRAKENSIQGLEEKVKTGEMSQEEYDEIIKIHEMTSEEIDRRIETERIDINTIRAFSDEDLENIYLAGGISTEIYEQYKNIRQLTDEEINERLEETREYYNNIANISDNWQTEDIWNNTLAYSSIAALWEGAQGYAGSVLNTNPLGMSQLAASVVNVTIDSTTSFLDTIVRAGARSLVEGSSFTENFEELGGLTQAFINAGTGGTTSFIFGELPDLIGAKAEGTLFMNKAEATSFRIGKLEESLGDDAEKIIVNAVIDGDIEKLNIDKKITNKLSEDDWWNYVKEKTVKRLEFDNVDSNKIEAFQTKILEEIKAKKIDVRTIYPQSPDELLKKFEETVSDSLEDTNIRRLCNDVEFAMYTNDPELYIKSKLNIKDCSTSELMDHFFELSEKDQETALRLIANKGAVIEDENIARQVVLYNKMLNDRNTGLDISKCKYYADENGKRVASGAWGNKNVHEVYTEKYGEYVEYIKKSLDITEKEATQMLDDLIKEGSESSTVTMINDSMVSYYSFFEEHQEVLQKYLDYQKITEMYDKITLLNNEEFKEFAKKVGYGDDEYANQIMAIASDDYLRFNEKFFDSGQTETTTINHEITHKLGNLYSDRKNDRGINEAATELIATKCTHRQTITAFKDNVESLNKIADVVGEDVLYEAYFSKNYKIFQTKLDEIMGEGFYDELKQQMFISIGGSNGVKYSIDERKLAQKTVNEMAERVTKVNSELGFEEMMDYANHKNMSVETPKIDWASKMAEANYHTRKGHFIGIPIQDVNDIPREFFEGIEDPSSVYFLQNGKRISYVEAKLANLNITMEKPKTDWASKMAEANYHTRKGHFIGIPIQDVNEIPIEFFEGIEDPRNVFFTQNGKKISFLKAKYSVLNMNQLKKDILLKVCDIDEQALKAKATYEELNKSVHYDFRYNMGDDETRQRLIDQTINFDRLDENMVICKGWSELYAEILNEQGIKAKVVKDPIGNHWWVEMELDNGRTIVADATEPMKLPGKSKQVDIGNSKIGAQTNGFFYITSDQKGSRPSDIQKTPEMIEEIKKMDIQLGYADEYGYPMDKLKLIEDNFPTKLYNLIFNKNNKEKATIDILSQMEIPDNLDGYDLFLRFRLLNEGDKLPLKINTSLLYKDGESVSYIAIKDDQNQRWFIEFYSKSLGRISFNTFEEAVKFRKKLGLVQIY